MDYKKINGKYHLVCPYCRHELEVDGASLESRLINLKRQLDDVDRRLGSLRDISPTMVDEKYRKNLVKKKDAVIDKLNQVKAEVHLVSQCSELEGLKAFRRMAKEVMGEEAWMELVKKAEKTVIDEQVYAYEELMRQKYTNFQGV